MIKKTDRKLCEFCEKRAIIVLCKIPLCRKHWYLEVKKEEKKKNNKNGK